MSLSALIDGPHARFSNGHVARPSARGRAARHTMTHAWHCRGIRPDGSAWAETGFTSSQAHAKATMNREIKIHVGSAISFAEVVPVKE